MSGVVRCHHGSVRVLACPDKFGGTASAREVGAAIAAAVAGHGKCVVQPMADGGEGTLDAFGGPNRITTVTGPLGTPVEAEWRLRDGVAVIEMARASGLLLAGGREHNDPMEATTTGTGELIVTAADAGASRIIVGLGGSATTDGGLGALRAMAPVARFKGVTLQVAADVRTAFVAAAAVFAPQKGASRSQVQLLERRLTRLAQVYETEHGIDVTGIERGGAAGGLGGGLAAAGAELCDGFELIAEAVDLYDAIEAADLVITGEGRLDSTSFDGKVVGGVARWARDAGVPVVAVVGRADDDVRDRIPTLDLTARFGATAALEETTSCVTRAVGEWLAAR